VHEHRSGRHRRLSVGTGKITFALGLCLCAGQLVSAPAVATPTRTPAAGVSAASVVTGMTAAAAVRPRITMAASRRSIAWGAKLAVRASVLDPRTAKGVRAGSVRLQAWRDGGWRTWQTKRLTSAGQVSFSTGPRLTGSIRVLFTGAGGYLAANSTSVRITVKASGAKILKEARKHVGKRYRFGAVGPGAFDCSGFTKYVFRKAAGRTLPHNAAAQARYGKRISRSKARPGDLIYLSGGAYAQHVGIYAGKGYMYDAPNPGVRVGKHKIWNRSYVVRRLA
jgi:cell wall-associated NlpC family hydrolase